MRNEFFYDLIDKEIDSLIDLFKGNEYLQKQDANGKKSFGFLLWFLKTYLPNGELNEFEPFITEGNDDSSCDLIFNNTDQEGRQIYYVVQAKWFKKTNISKANEMTKEIKACLSDFRLIMSGKKAPSTVNKQFNKQYTKFLEHKKSNGRIKFIFTTLCKGEKDIKEHIAGFVSELVSFEPIDLDTLKKNYIELNYKEIKTHNPLETPYIPRVEFDLNFISSNNIKVPSYLPHESYIFLVKPVEIYRLFNHYSFSLFYKNIRNPLPNSLFNKEISNTIKKNPLNFWYFNNGITAITEKIYPFHAENDNVKLKGIQVINGAQTVFSIYESYLYSTDAERVLMNDNALITLRVLKTGGFDFDLSVTKFTNSQNPINDRDFYSNDDVQLKLQSDFLKDTNIWFETRRGEFRKKLKGINIVSNEDFAQSYLSYTLQDPFNAKQNRKNIFVSSVTNPEGLYDKIFTSSTNHLEMLISYKIYHYIEAKRKETKRKINEIDPLKKKLSKIEKDLMNLTFLQYASFDILGLMHYLIHVVNSDNSKAINGKLKSAIEESKFDRIEEYYNFIVNKLRNYIIELQAKDRKLVHSVWFKAKESYPRMKADLISARPSALKKLKKL